MAKKVIKMSKTAKKAVAAKEEKKPVKLDFACGSRVQEGFEGVDVAPIEGVKHVVDLFKYPLPWGDNSVDEIYCSHFVEHVPDLIGFMNECYRILKPKGTMQIIAPYYSSMRAWQDPTHVRAISEASFLYYNKAWRQQNLLEHYPITADFDFSYGYNVNNPWGQKNEETRAFAIAYYINAVSDIIVTLTKAVRDAT